MEVLTEVDPGADRGAARARRVLLARPRATVATDALDAAGELLGLHPLALEDTREFGQRAKLDRYPDAVLLVFWTARTRADERGVEQIEVHLHISGGFLFTVRRSPVRASSTRCTTRSCPTARRPRTTSSTACSTR